MSDKDEGLIELMGASVDWDKYADSLRESNRHFLQDPTYFNQLVASCLGCKVAIRPGQDLFRARIHPLDAELSSEPLKWEELGPPPISSATPGRLNPAGIAYFYLAFESDTAVAEIRPWKGARITLARYVTHVPLEVLDLRPSRTAGESSSSLRWTSFMLGRPAHRDDQWAYLGMQYLAERLKGAGVDGLLYGSALNLEGTNLALFGDRPLRRHSRELREVASVQYKSDLLDSAP